MAEAARIVALSGGVGGAKLVLGLAHAMPPGHLTVIANTGDDFEHLGLAISPDLDTLLYTLAGLANPETGWGRRDEGWRFMEALAALGGETWFRLGDRDLATHVERTRRLKAGESLSDVMESLAGRLGVKVRLLPMSDRPVRTEVETATGPLPFQVYFVRERAAPKVTGFRFVGGETAQANPLALAALADPTLGAVLIGPSNPFISIDPILAVPRLRQAIRAAGVPVIAVSPIVAGAALKGPTAKMMAELGLEVSALAVARHYRGLLDGFVLDEVDAALATTVAAEGMAVHVTRTVMQSLDDRVRLAQEMLDFARRLAPARAASAARG
jgi:LPPG:FO 2-phospho-L-lactate transferase